MEKEYIDEIQGYRRTWLNTENLDSHAYVCGWCNEKVASKDGFRAEGLSQENIYICTHCRKPSYFPNRYYKDTNGSIVTEHCPAVPQTKFTGAVKHVPKSVNLIYEEARLCHSSGAYTMAALACRKLLMNIGVNKGADDNKSFAYYVDYLDQQNYFPQGTEAWVQKIRDRGNTATHEITPIECEESGQSLRFSEMLLKIIYEFPGIAAQ